uniref:Uncharacterized protein n=1 Tax=Arundo donax TaxID=35708 RepID=A0A0A9DVI8_ARUDO
MEVSVHSLPLHIQQGKYSIVQPPQFGISMASCTLLQEDAQRSPLEQEQIQLKKMMVLMMIKQQTAGGFHPEPQKVLLLT